ncbi:MAG: DUF5058 family protein [Clostridia bacterium]
MSFISTSTLAAANVNSPYLYLLYAFVVVFVISQCTFYLVKSLRRAKALNMDMSKIKQVIIRSISFSILPSIGIFIGIVTLIGALGIPLPSIRLSIIGALQYEAMAAGMAADAIVGGSNGLNALFGNITAEQYVTIAAVMTIGIIWGPLFMFTLYKRFQKNLNKVTKSGSNKWNDILFGAVFVGMVLAFFVVAIAGIFKMPSNIASYYNVIAVVVSALAMWGFDVLIKKSKQEWLENFSLTFSMLAGMIVVAVISYCNPNATIELEQAMKPVVDALLLI